MRQLNSTTFNGVKKAKQFSKNMLNSFLVLLLLIAPIELLFAKTDMTHDMSKFSMSISPSSNGVLSANLKMHFVDSEITNSEITNAGMTGGEITNSEITDIKMTAGDSTDDCEKNCPHCVFCSAAVTPILPLNATHLISIYNPCVNELSSELYPDLHIEPPIS